MSTCLCILTITVGYFGGVRARVKMYFLFYVWVVLFSTFVHGQSRFPISVNGNGYEGVTIAISENVQEDSKLVDNIKSAFTKASGFLYTSTKRMLYFKEITIAIPKTWKKNDSYLQLPGSRFATAPIRVDSPGALNLTPYVRGLTECGGEGKFMHLTPGLLNGDTLDYGPHANYIVHEWGHLKWGLFDEYATVQDASKNLVKFYLSNGTWRPVRCTENVNGYNSVECSNPKAGCDLSLVNLKPDSNCSFCVNQTNTAKASIMAFQFLTSLDGFCETDPGPGRDMYKHNSLADNHQNKFCDKRSAWDVMNDNMDFQGRTPGAESQNTVPNFQIIQESGENHVVLVIDVSGSMKGELIESVNRVARTYIRGTLQIGTSVGIVIFNATAYTAHNIVKINSGTERDSLIQSLTNYANGGTSIGGGLQLGFQLLENYNSILNGTVLFLITDGKENESPFIADVLPKMISAGVIVSTLALTENADEDLEAISRATGGFSYFYSGGSNSTGLVDAFNTIAGQTSNNAPMQILTEYININSMTPYLAEFVLGTDLGLDTIVQVVGENSEGIQITLTTPSGSIYKNNVSDVLPNITIPGTAESGTYHLNISCNSCTGVVVVQSKRITSDDSSEMVTLNGWTSSKEYTYSDSMKVSIFAMLMKGYLKIANATVTATIENPDGKTTVLKLRDNGIGADLLENDSVYSAYLLSTSIEESGRHDVKITADNMNDEAVILVPIPQQDGVLESQVVYTTMKLGPLQLSVKAEEFNVVGTVMASTSDKIPPSQITTLELYAVGEIPGTFTIAWRAVGDDFDMGNTSAYIISISMVYEDLFHDSGNSNVTQLNTSSHVPNVPGALETFQITIPSVTSGTYYVSVQAVDEQRNTGNVSNVVTYSVLTDTTNWAVKTEEVVEESASATVAVVLVVIGVVILILVILSLLYFRMRTKSSTYQLRSEVNIGFSFDAPELINQP